MNNCLKIILFSLLFMSFQLRSEENKTNVKVVIEPLNEASIYQLDTIWKTQDNKSLKLKDFAGKTVIMALIYGSCPHVCPLTISDVAKIQNGLSAKAREHSTFVLVTIDPKRDTPQALKKLAKKRGLKNWFLLNGGEQGVLELAMTLGVKYKKTKNGGFSHSNIISIFNQKGVLIHQQLGLNQDPKQSIMTIEKENK